MRERLRYPHFECVVFVDFSDEFFALKMTSAAKNGPS